jgi:hypothetical protein
MVENLDKLFVKSANLNYPLNNINYISARIKKQEKMKQNRIMIIIVAILVLLNIFILFFIGDAVCIFFDD